MDLRLTAKAAATDEERAAVDEVLGPPLSQWEGGARRPEDAHVAFGGHAARAQRHLLITVLHAVQERAGWISAAEPRSHLPRHGERCQVTLVPLSPVSLSTASVPSGPNRRVISAHSDSTPATLQATSSQMCTTAPGDGVVRNMA